MDWRLVGDARDALHFSYGFRAIVKISDDQRRDCHIEPFTTVRQRECNTREPASFAFIVVCIGSIWACRCASAVDDLHGRIVGDDTADVLANDPAREAVYLGRAEAAQ